MQLIGEPIIVHQGVDTLVLNFKLLDAVAYASTYKKLLDKLEVLKKEAQRKEDFGTKFVRDNLDLCLGEFLISSKGNHRYRFYIENQDFLAFLSTAPVGSNLPQIQVHFRAKFLFKEGLKKAIDLVEVFIQKAFGSTQYTREIARIDLTTDVMGIRYDGLDMYRFQTIMGQKNFVEVADIKTFGRFYKVQGFTFGSGDKLFRIYDKSEKIKRSPEEAYIEDKWRYNGFDGSSPVFRHEVQLRREVLKRFIPNSYDEVKWLFNNVGKLWKYGVSLLEWVDLSDDEVLKVVKGMSSDARRQMFYRIKNDENRYKFWQLLDVWDNQYQTLPDMYAKELKTPNLKTAEKYLKAFISSVYKVMGTDPSNLSSVVYKINTDLYNDKGYTIHDYAVSRLADSISRYAKYALQGGFIPEWDYSEVVNRSMWDFTDVLRNVSDRNLIKPINKVLEVVNG